MIGAGFGTGWRGFTADAPEIDDGDRGCKAEEAPATGVKGEGAGPELLIDREGRVPGEAEDKAENADAGKGCGFARGGVRGAEPEGSEYSEESCGDGGNGGQEALGVARAFVQVRRRKYVAVEPSREVGLAVVDRDLVRGDSIPGDRNETHQQPVSDEESDSDGQLILPARRDQIDGSGEEVADCDPREHTVVAGRGYVEEREIVDDETEDDQQHGSAGGVQEEFAACGSATQARLRREHGRVILPPPNVSHS